MDPCILGEVLPLLKVNEPDPANNLAIIPLEMPICCRLSVDMVKPQQKKPSMGFTSTFFNRIRQVTEALIRFKYPGLLFGRMT